MIDLVEVMRDGTYAERLEALRDHLAGRLITAESREAAAITKELRATLAELERLGVGGEESELDDLLSED
ncbi:hypothetical protein V6U89_29800 [Micromonospora sp. CPCC 206171]|uniref:hypothetical protein n=1 Tax=Micromonospora sp. CPCC 206171 TaxID=3122405 RepID=UPI002FF06F67